MKTGMALFVFGMLLCFGAVGGIENNGPLVDGMIVAVLGLAIAYCGTLMIKREEA